jgi:hypothetical protein
MRLSGLWAVPFRMVVRSRFQTFAARLLPALAAVRRQRSIRLRLETARGGPISDLLLTMGFARQAVATDGNGFRLSEPLAAPSHLRPVATGCDRWAP